MYAIIHIGSNIDPSRNVRRSIELLSLRVKIRRLSAVYLTDPEERPGDPRFYNCAISVETSLSPEALRDEVLRPIEKRLGRVRGHDKYSPRPIDLDLVIFGNGTARTRTLLVSGLDLLRRPHLAIPLAELEPDLIVPGEGVSLAEAVKNLPTIERLDAYSASLHDEFDRRKQRLTE